MPAAQHAVGRPRRQHRLPARGQASRCARAAARPAQAGLDRRVRVGRHDPLRRAAAHREPARGVPRDRQQPHRRRRLPAPHHLGVDDRLPRAAHRGAARRARAPLARRLRAHAARLLLVPRRRDGAPALAPAPAEPARDPRDRAAQELGRRPRPRHGRRHDLPRVHGRVRGGDRARRGRRRGAGRALPEQVGRSACSRSSPRRGASRRGCSSCGTRATRPGSPRRARGRPWDDVALEALAAALDGLEERFGRDPDGGAGAACTASSSRTRSAQANPLFRRIFNRTVEAGGASETVTQNGYLADRAVQGRVGTRLPDARRPRRPAPLALAAHHRPVGPARLARTTTT